MLEMSLWGVNPEALVIDGRPSAMEVSGALEEDSSVMEGPL